MHFKRYAIYQMFAPGAAYDAGAAWLGWDAVAGRPVKQPVVSGFDLENATARPRHYGLHGTIKPPFVLAAGYSAQSLILAAQELCSDLEPVVLTGLHLQRIGGFLALVPEMDSLELSALAAQVVAGLDAFRAPPSAEELRQRRARRLTARQEALLLKWGYPHVMDEFRFHITLTGRLRDAEMAAARQAAEALILPLLPRPLVIDDLALVGEDAAGRFHLVTRIPLGRRVRA